MGKSNTDQPTALIVSRTRLLKQRPMIKVLNSTRAFSTIRCSNGWSQFCCLRPFIEDRQCDMPDPQENIGGQQNKIEYPKNNPGIHGNPYETKKTTALKAMVLHFHSNSREISFRLDDCLSRKSRAATPHRSN